MTREINFETLPSEIGRRLREFRAQRGLTQKELADGAGVSRPQLARYESGEDLPQPKALIRFADYMEATLDWLVYGDAEEAPTPNDRALRECLVELQHASPQCRFAAIEMMHVLLIADRAEERLLAPRNDNGNVGDAGKKIRDEK
jgi:transcriptional regulator with XRE-family HTH domain